MNASRFLLALFLTLTTFTGVLADLDIAVVTHDTDVQSTYNRLKACSCGGTIDSVTVKNLGMLESSYAFELVADQPWFTISPEGAYLRPGESREVYIFTSAPCDAVGAATYTVYAASEYGRYRAVEKTVQVGVCENILASVSPMRATIEPCSTQTFDLKLSNVATFTETYEIDYLGFPATTILPGESKTIQGAYTAACDEWGNRTIPVTVRSLRNGLTREVPVTIEVPRSYDFSLSLGDVMLPVCADAKTTIPVYLRNLESRANTIALTATGSSGMNVTVPAKTTMVVDLPFSPIKAGDRVFTVVGTGLNGSIEKQADLTVPVEACFGYEINAPKTITSCPGSVSVPFTITSDGSRNQALSISVLSNTTTSIDSLSAKLLPSAAITKTVEAIIPDANRAWYVTLKAETLYRSEEQTVKINGISTESCYEAAPTSDKFTVWTDENIVPFIVTQTGVEPATYTLKYNGTYATLMEREVTLAPGESAVLHLAINATGYSTGRSINRLMLSANGVDYVTDFELKLRNKGFWQNFSDVCSADKGFAICSGASVIALLFLIGIILFIAAVLARIVVFENPRGRSKERWGIVGGLVLLVLLAMLVWSAPNIPRSYDRPVGPSSPSDLAFEIGQGQSITVDLGAHFLDADNDSLRFLANQPQHLTVRVQGRSATISADGDWAGTEYLVFTADDNRGGHTDSDLFMVSVVPYRPVTFLEYWLRSCWFLTYLFLFIAFALILLLVLLSRSPEDAEVTRREARTLHRQEVQESKASAQVIIEDDAGSDRPLTVLERDVLRQAQTIVNAEKLIVNQGTESETVYVASAEGKRFHKMTCPVVRNMPKTKRVTFNTKEDAIKGGFSPCKTCGSHQ